MSGCKAYRKIGSEQWECECGDSWHVDDGPLGSCNLYNNTSDGSTASYYQLPEGSEQLQDLISYRNMNGQIAEIFRSCYRYGRASHSDQLRDAKKIAFYAQAEVARLEKYGSED